jgi:hypothetical protein
MTFNALLSALRALHEANVRYLVVGGFAVAAHGYRRATVDLDLVLQLEPDNVRKGLEALASVGYLPKAPVTPAQFGDPAMRERWIRDKGMVVLNLWNAVEHGATIDIFVEEPFDFDDEYARAILDELVPGLPVRYPRLDALIAMKLAAARPKDLDDVAELRRINAD